MISKLQKNPCHHKAAIRAARIIVCTGLFSVMSFGIMSAAFAGTCTGVGRTCTDVTIDRVFISSNGKVYIATSGDESALSGNSGCTAFGGQYIVLRPDMEDRDKLLAIFMTAHERRKPITEIRMRSPATYPECSVNHVYIDQ